MTLHRENCDGFRQAEQGRQLERELFVAASEIAALEHPYYCAMDRLLEEHGFDEFAEEI